MTVEFRCEQCSHVGRPDGVEPTSSGLFLRCAHCGHETALDLSSQGGAEADHPSDPSPRGSDWATRSSINLENLRVDQPEARPGFGTSEDVRTFLRTDVMESLIPEPGLGPRCPKCLTRLRADAIHCDRCGLNQREADEFAPGQAPWERPPAGKEVEFEQAALLWSALEDDPDEAGLVNYVGFIKSADLLDTGIRQLRIFLADHPDDTRAREHLRDLAESLQSRIIVAQVQAKASADNFLEDVGRFKTKMIGAALLFWGGIFLLFLVLFWDSCG